MNFSHLSRLLCAVVLAASAATATAQKNNVTEENYKFRVTLTDKNNCGYSVKNPQAFLSQKSLDRRKRMGLKVDEHDLPVTSAYTDRIKALGLRVVCQSKWNNTVVVATSDSAQAATLQQLPFVKDVRCVWIRPEAPDTFDASERLNILENRADTLTDYYGRAQRQTEMLGVDKLHAMGYKGDGVTIAVVDGGFFNADVIKGFTGTKILGTRNFVRPSRSVYEEQSHGMMVLSCIAAHTPHSFVGTAPEASFYLLMSEDCESEQLVEEDYWCAAVEYADSVGADMVTSSLGYYHFDHEFMNHKYADLDGRTALNSRSASLMASRGMLLLNSAGNSGDEPWKKISFPADGFDMLTVGAVSKDGLNTNFSSLGNSADNRIKPDVMAMGGKATVYSYVGNVDNANGTSFSCPIMCGAVACLVQAFPHATPAEIADAVRKAGSEAECPNNVFGYGIPDMKKAYDFLKTK